MQITDMKSQQRNKTIKKIKGSSETEKYII